MHNLVLYAEIYSTYSYALQIIICFVYLLYFRVRSVTLDIPAREKISYFSGGSSPEVSLKEIGEKLESATSPTGVLKSSLHNSGVRRSNAASKNNNHVKFVTPSTTLDVSHTLQVDVVLHSIERLNGSPWRHGRSSQETIEAGITIHKEDDEDSTRQRQSQMKRASFGTNTQTKSYMLHALQSQKTFQLFFFKIFKMHIQW